jgi:hypothetical protein
MEYLNGLDLDLIARILLKRIPSCARYLIDFSSEKSAGC